MLPEVPIPLPGTNALQADPQPFPCRFSMQHPPKRTRSCLFANTKIADCRISGSLMICCRRGAGVAGGGAPVMWAPRIGWAMPWRADPRKLGGSRHLRTAAAVKRRVQASPETVQHRVLRGRFLQHAFPPHTPLACAALQPPSQARHRACPAVPRVHVP